MAAKPLPIELNVELKTAGHAMLHELDRIGLRPQGALWLHYPLVRDWRFVIITPLVGMLGRLKVYSLIDEALDKIGPVEGLTLLDIHLYDSDDFVARNLGQIVIEGGEANFVQTSFNGMVVDAVVFRLLPKPSKSETKMRAHKFEKTVSRLANA